MSPAPPARKVSTPSGPSTTSESPSIFTWACLPSASVVVNDIWLPEMSTLAFTPSLARLFSSSFSVSFSDSFSSAFLPQPATATPAAKPQTIHVRFM